MIYILYLGVNSVVGHVPGSIYTDLMYNKIIGEPYYRFNDEAYRWVAKDNWTYSTNFMSKCLKFVLNNCKGWQCF